MSSYRSGISSSFYIALNPNYPLVYSYRQTPDRCEKGQVIVIEFCTSYYGFSGRWDIRLQAFLRESFCRKPTEIVEAETSGGRKRRRGNQGQQRQAPGPGQPGWGGDILEF